jgi:hypothetical protein
LLVITRVRSWVHSNMLVFFTLLANKKVSELSNQNNLPLPMSPVRSLSLRKPI